MSDIIAYKGELQLKGWAESDKQGRTVRFLCSGDEDDHPFKAFTPNTRFAVVLVEIGDDEKPVQQEQKASVDHTKLKLSNQAALLCKDGDFWLWLGSKAWGVTVASESTATALVKEFMGIDSRSELDINPGKALKFNSEILLPFREWQRLNLKVA